VKTVKEEGRPWKNKRAFRRKNSIRKIKE